MHNYFLVENSVWTSSKNRTHVKGKVIRGQRNTRSNSQIGNSVVMDLKHEKQANNVKIHRKPQHNYNTDRNGRFIKLQVMSIHFSSLASWLFSKTSSTSYRHWGWNSQRSCCSSHSWDSSVNWQCRSNCGHSTWQSCKASDAGVCSPHATCS